MDGANLHGGSMEVAFEQWTEQGDLSRLQRIFPPLQGKRYRLCLIHAAGYPMAGVQWDIVYIQAVSVSAECRYFYLNLGGNTDCTFALSF